MYGTTRRLLDLQLREQRLVTYAVVGLALVIALLTALGIQGLVAYSVTQRTHEIAIRMALGAETHGVRTMVMRRPARLAVIGVALGSLGAWVVTRMLGPFLHATSPTDPVAITVAVAMMFAVVLLASWMPARRATRVDPMRSLRAE